VLVGTWLCAAVDPLVAPTIPVMAQRVAELLDGAARYETAPPALTLTAHALLHRSGLIVPGLARFVDQVRAVLAAEPPRSAAMDVTRCEKRILLHQLGLADSPPLMTPAMARSTIVGMTLQPDPEQRTDAVLAAESATGHGTVASDDEPSAAVLERHAVHQYRSGDLAAGCALVRAAHHLRPLATERAGEFIDHLLLNRRSGGGYGYLPAIGDHSADLDLDLDVRLHLPTTLTCLWTVAELNSDFRLYRSLMGVHHVGFGQSGV